MVDNKWNTTIEDITTAANTLIKECSDDKLKQSYLTYWMSLRHYKKVQKKANQAQRQYDFVKARLGIA